MVMGMMVAGGCYAQEDANLKEMTKDLLAIRKAKASNNVLNTAVLNWSASGKPKMTLMDEIRRDKDNEYRGNGANRFKMNQVVTHVYSRQNTGMVSKGDYFNSTEKDVYYSAIEKTIKKGCIATYTLVGHVGEQEFVFVSFNPNTQFTATVNGVSTLSKDGVAVVKLPKVEKEDTITFSIKNGPGSNESFVILNHNPQK
jgi:hypothetical protein